MNEFALFPKINILQNLKVWDTLSIYKKYRVTMYKWEK